MNDCTPPATPGTVRQRPAVYALPHLDPTGDVAYLQLELGRRLAKNPWQEWSAVLLTAVIATIDAHSLGIEGLQGGAGISVRHLRVV
ncbi:Uncharacterised protein [Mycobacteroides abscessus subsp. massiliense]|nr:Uncharacterised protein [Mycobacteroides abscessus subsp. bolletii]SKD36674.1 Uncharacterised protein [Mycobacteroides abscessus subsp. massiliense]SII70378.1 Uncharacterised protein [Mycobacteroides abscessus subsp. bolletii]SKD36943.1 Uncharacterised protein [Mycobacteroides abscessus subsp. massiliense]SKD46777.1 Uncharacterised protein [Mycobacteroides abscessus subsp. massiliense]